MNYFPKFNQKEREIFRVQHQKGMIENSVNFFSGEMKKELLKHLDRPGWKRESIEYLIHRLYEEMVEFRNAIESSQPREAVIKEGADVANFVMMITEVYKKRG